MKKIVLTAAFFALALPAIGWGEEDKPGPVLTWNTFLGAGGDESANGIALDLGGTSTSRDGPPGPGARPSGLTRAITMPLSPS